MLDLLLTTILKRPYVFAFLASFLFLGVRLWGWKRTFLWLFLGYGVAWASEYSSIHNGFPYGLYHYLESGLQGELKVFGVPFFDSLSYTFLIFAGYTTACFATRTLASSLYTTLAQVFLGAFFTMLLDMIVDPLAHLGEYWFLGEIYYYEYPGKYFDVPITNFLGWFLVALVVIGVNALTGCHSERSEESSSCTGSFTPFRMTNKNQLDWYYPAFFFSIVLFNLGITAWVHAWALLACSTVLTIVCALLCFFPKLASR